MVARNALKEARLYERLEDGSLRCGVCHNACRIGSGSRGVCGNYINVDGRLYHLGYGRLSAVESRPIEIKPLFHYWPGSTSLTFSGWGCNFHCPWCQNSHLSFRPPAMEDPVTPPEELVERAIRLGDEGVCASFNEPATLFDYLLDVFELASKRGLYSTIVTNGYFTSTATRLLVESGCDGWSIDIKGCPTSKSALHSVDHELVIKCAKRVASLGGHVEMVYLVVTGFNDSEGCARWIITRIVDELGPDTPLHVNRYYPSHRWMEPETSLEKLTKIAAMAREEGLKYIYIGNVWDPRLESTRCPRCNKMLIYRRGYRVLEYHVTRDSRCPRCGERVPIRGRPILKRAWLL